MKFSYFFTFVFCLGFYHSIAVTITEGLYKGIEHFIVYTKYATYYYDKSGGAFSRIVDKQGNDWVGFKKDPWETYPESAASSFRGVPNLVYESDDHGVGMPGYEKCSSEKIGRRSIQTTSLSGKWQWTWVFHKKYAELIIEKIDANHKYGFMYNGIIAGRFNPDNQYYGTNLGGPIFKKYDLYQGEKIYGNWQWSYFGDRDFNRVFFVASANPEHHIDSYSILGNSSKGIDSENGMVTFGFGVREGFSGQLREEDAHFLIGFIHKRIEKPKDHLKIKKLIEGYMK